MSMFGLDSEALPDGWTPLEAVAVVKCLDSNGVTGLALRTTEGLALWEAVGMLIAAADTERAVVGQCFEAEE